MSARQLYEWAFSQLDRSTGISFTTSFDFALASLLLKGLFHQSPLTATRTVNLLRLMVGISGKSYRQKKDDVIAENLPYFARKLVVSRCLPMDVNLLVLCSIVS